MHAHVPKLVTKKWKFRDPGGSARIYARKMIFKTLKLSKKYQAKIPNFFMLLLNVTATTNRNMDIYATYHIAGTGMN